MEDEIPNQKGGDGGVEIEGKECGQTQLNIDIVVEGDNVQEGGPIMHIQNEEGGVSAQVVLDHQSPWEAGVSAVMAELPGIHHHLHTLFPMKKGVVEVPVGVCSPTEDVLSISFVICTCHTNAGKPRLCHAKQIICLIRCQEGMHSKFPPLHVHGKNGLSRHVHAWEGLSSSKAWMWQRMRREVKQCHRRPSMWEVNSVCSTAMNSIVVWE